VKLKKKFRKKIHIPPTIFRYLKVLMRSAIPAFSAPEGRGFPGTGTGVVKLTPELKAQKWRTVTRTVLTTAAPAELHKLAPWLFPDEGKGERPRVFYEDGKVLYPVWGTWQKRVGKIWVALDENGLPIELTGGNKERGNPVETRVDFYVVTDK
jgi:hypothetical protein